ncbi:MAG TPA: glutamine--fructose-6-phosphate aminotransferase [Myxococcales bacterium]|nr:glutamine--fructose-6-phosphate aminotransferase [Myxococcales bacterium]
MCGVIGLVFERSRDDLGRIAAELLKTLEYRGYDSTGAAIQGDGEAIQLVKGVGAPSLMVHKLGIVDMTGQVLCGQVRWATFGAVNDTNSQPHEVVCKCHLYGAHNGNVTNCDALKAWLLSEGHEVLSDNDGEMVVHTVEHYFAQALASQPPEARRTPEVRRRCMRSAIGAAAARLEGSFAAVIVDPVSRVLWAIKLGSSLYFGFGRDEKGGAFGLASSDLSSVLKLTRVLVPVSEGEFVEFAPSGYAVYGLSRARGQEPTLRERQPVRSRLRAEDTGLLPPFETFMDQEIAAQEATVRNVVSLFLGGTEASKVLRPCLESHPAELRELAPGIEALRDQFSDEAIGQHFHQLVDLPAFEKLIDSVPPAVREEGIDAPAELLSERLASSEAGFLADLLKMARGPRDLFAVRLLDVLLEREEEAEFAAATDRFTMLCGEALSRGGRIFVTCSGTSFHAAKAATLFFNELARTELIPVLPGEFRGQYGRSLKDGDLFIAVSQSGETKDLIDVMNDVIASGKDICRVAIVNNVNSTLAQEKSELVIPLRCGPEIAVPATKSFMNQVAIFYGLALKLASRRLQEPELAAKERELALRWERLPTLPALIRATVDGTAMEIEKAAQLLYLAPSIQILATRISAVAKEGALKIREVVLNHSEGFEGSEFKHGPNTILGVNTVFGPLQVDALLKSLGVALDTLLERAAAMRLESTSLRRLVQAATDSVLSAAPAFSLDPEEQALFESAVKREELLGSLYADYPLIYVTGPEERDVALTISQINTHKIRGASTVVIAEENAALRSTCTKPPADNPHYRSVFIALPRTNDTLLTVFSSTVVLQRLALRMSLLKAQYLDRLGLKDHGVHPDVPKNVSKSITVD